MKFSQPKINNRNVYPFFPTTSIKGLISEQTPSPAKLKDNGVIDCYEVREL